MTEHYRGAIAGRTMYVIAFCMGPLDAEDPRYEVQSTDSEPTSVTRQITTRSGAPVWDKLTDGTGFVKCLHSVGARELATPASAVEIDEWVAETASIDEWYATIGGKRLPDQLRAQLAALKLRPARVL